MAITILTSDKQKFNNYTISTLYRNIPKKDVPNTDLAKSNNTNPIDPKIEQMFDLAEPELYALEDNWQSPTSKITALNTSNVNKGQDDVHFYNKFLSRYGNNVFAIVSGNVSGATSYMPVIVSCLVTTKDTNTNTNITSVATASISTNEYYFYLSEREYKYDTTSKISIAVDGKLSASNKLYEFSKTNINKWVTTYIDENDTSAKLKLGIFHATDFKIGSQKRKIKFDGTQTSIPAFNTTKQATVTVGTKALMSTFALSASWPSFSAVSTTTTSSTTYTITAWDVVNGTKSTTIANSKYYTMPGDNDSIITCYPKLATNVTILPPTYTLKDVVLTYTSAKFSSIPSSGGTVKIGGNTYDVLSSSKLSATVCITADRHSPSNKNTQSNENRSVSYSSKAKLGSKSTTLTGTYTWKATIDGDKDYLHYSNNTVTLTDTWANVKSKTAGTVKFDPTGKTLSNGKLKVTLTPCYTNFRIACKQRIYK